MTKPINNADKSEFTPPKERPEVQAPPPQMPPPQTLKCFLVPVEAMESIRDCVREAPFKYAQPVMQGLANLQIADVPVGPPPGAKPQ